MARPKIPNKCHPELAPFARGVCKACYDKSYRKNNKSKIEKLHKEWRIKNREQVNSNSRHWEIANKEKVQATKRKYVKKNLNKYRSYCAKRHAAKMQRIPKWADLEAIRNFYLNCPSGMEVDHIIPLQGHNVSGLHVLENLQYLTPEENRKKYNKFKG